MNPAAASAIPQIDPLPLPAPAGLMWFLLILTFFLHLLAMNFVLGGSVIGLLARLRGTDPARPHPRALASWIWKLTPTALAFTVTFGVAPLLFVQALYGRLFFPGSVLMAWFWFAVVPLVMLAYYGAYVLAFKGERLGGLATALAAVVTLFFLAVAFLYTSNMTMMLRPETFLAKYRAAGDGWHLNLDDPTFWPRFLHNVLGAIAVAGMFVAHYGLARAKRDADPAFGRWAMRHGSIWFAVATAVSVLAGMWWLIALPRETMLRFMGQNMVATISMGVGILLGVATLVLAAMAINTPDPARLLRASGGALVLTLVFMILMRDQVRQGALEAAGFAVNPWVAPQWGPIAIFLVLLVAAIGTVIWMAASLARAKPQAPGA